MAAAFEQLPQADSGRVRGVGEIRARLLHETRQGERSEAEALGVRLQRGLTQPIALMERLSGRGGRGLGPECRLEGVELGDQ